VLEVRQQLGQTMAAVVLAGQETQQPVENPQCPQCGEAMRYKGRKGKAVESRVGGLKVERGYYYCARCACGLFPPGRAT
jgi:tRNA(Ile2) C34 agmatinyltransferase TiaS